MNPLQKKLVKCIVANFFLLLVITVLSIVLNDGESSYFRYGPSSELRIISVRIDSWTKYWILQVLLAFIEVTNVTINEIASPILGFNIYNPDKKIITDFSRIELQFYANTMWMISSLRGTLTIIISISQIDIAVLRTIYSELASFYTIRILLLEKKFPEDDQSSPEYFPL